MKALSGKFVAWLMGLTTLMRYFVIAVLLHVAVLFLLASIKIAVQLPKIAAIFGGGAPPPLKEDDVDPFAALRDFEYNGPTLGGGGGTPGKGPGGIPTAAGTTPTEYKANITAVDKTAADSSVAEVIGVVSDSANAVARLAGGGLGAVSAPTTGFGEGKIGTAGIKGPGGGGFRQRQGPMRAQAISKHKGTQDTEKAVLAALRWLKENQNSDGSWSKANRHAMSALALLCFLGHGETPDSEEFGPTVTKAISFLVSNVSGNGIASGNMYEQGAVTLALAEAYGMTQSPVVKEPLERMVRANIESQKIMRDNPKLQGGWHYSPNARTADTSVSGWLIMGIKSARIAGVTLPDEPFKMASDYLWNVYDPNGGFGYSGPSRSFNMSAVGALCQMFLEHGDNTKIKKALDFLKTHKVDWEKASGHALYGWYYATQAMFQGGGSYWEYWNKEIRDKLVKNQASDGHWESPSAAEGAHGPVYSTTLCCLMLEVYYRYLPIYQEMEKKSLPPMQLPGTAPKT